jgi:hypothetical protein
MCLPNWILERGKFMPHCAFRNLRCHVILQYAGYRRWQHTSDDDKVRYVRTSRIESAEIGRKPIKPKFWVPTVFGRLLERAVLRRDMG